MENIEESRLLIAIAEGSEKAFQQLYEQYHHKMGAYIFRLTDSHETSEEIVQDVFLKIWQNRNMLHTIKSVEAYLFVLSKNLALNCLQSAVASRARMLKLEYHYKQVYTNDNYTEAENQEHLLLDEAIKELPEQQQKAYILSRHGKLKTSQVAKEMNLSVETVKKYLKIATSSIINRLSKNKNQELIIFILFSF